MRESPGCGIEGPGPGDADVADGQPEHEGGHAGAVAEVPGVEGVEGIGHHPAVEEQAPEPGTGDVQLQVDVLKQAQVAAHRARTGVKAMLVTRSARTPWVRARSRSNPRKVVSPPAKKRSTLGSREAPASGKPWS